MYLVESPPTKRSKKTTTKRTTNKAKSTKKDTDLQSRIEISAYYKAKARGFAPGHELEDWLSAEKEENQ